MLHSQAAGPLIPVVSTCAAQAVKAAEDAAEAASAAAAEAEASGSSNAADATAKAALAARLSSQARPHRALQTSSLTTCKCLGAEACMLSLHRVACRGQARESSAGADAVDQLGCAPRAFQLSCAPASGRSSWGRCMRVLCCQCVCAGCLCDWS